MKTQSAVLGLALCLVACANSKKADPKPPAPETGGGCAHDHSLPELKPDASQRKLLAARSETPQTAADYYFLLPAANFSNVENSAERRATFVSKDSPTNQYVHAEHWFECDGGGFEVTIRVFETADGPLVAILSSTYPNESLLKNEQARPGELQSIHVNRPKFWRVRDGKWLAVDDKVLPDIDKDFVIDRYRNHYKAHLKYADQQKNIWLEYELPPNGLTLAVKGRENFMDPSETYIWRTFRFDGKRFVSVD